MKILLLRAELFHADGLTDKHDEASSFRNSANAPKNDYEPLSKQKNKQPQKGQFFKVITRKYSGQTKYQCARTYTYPHTHTHTHYRNKSDCMVFLLGYLSVT